MDIVYSGKSVIISTSKSFVRGRIADTVVPRSIHGFRSTCTDIAVIEAVFNFKKCKSIHNTDIAVPIYSS